MKTNSELVGALPVGAQDADGLGVLHVLELLEHGDLVAVLGDVGIALEEVLDGEDEEQVRLGLGVLRGVVEGIVGVLAAINADEPTTVHGRRRRGDGDIAGS